MKQQEKINKKVIAIIAVVFAVALFFGVIVNFATEFLWFRNVGFLSVFTVGIITKLLIFFPIMLLLCIVLNIYIKRLFGKYSKLGEVVYSDKQKKTNKTITLIFSVIFSMYYALIVTQEIWFKLLEFINRTQFNIADPIFGKDISFYVFTLPFLNSLLGYVILLIVSFIIITVLFYLLMPRIYAPAEGSLYDYNEIAARPNLKSIFRKDLVKYGLKKLAVLGFSFFVLLGFYFYLKGFYLMYSSRGIAFGASYADINVTLLGYRAIIIIALIGAPIFFYGIMKGKKVLMFIVPILIAAVFVVSSVTALVVQQLVVEPDEINKEREYIEYNIDFTQNGFNLHDVETIDFDITQDLTYEDILDNVETIGNIRINDARPLKQTLNQIQVMRLYYEFNDVDIDRYYINGKYTQVFISARELNSERLSESAQTWINKHLKYTHGYGVIMAPVNEVSSSGQPQLIVKNIPPISTVGMEITRPEIYFGELANDYIVVNAEEKEFDYPSGSDNKETLYSGTAGINLTWFNRVLFSIRENSMKMFLSSNVTADSKIIIYRDIKKRVEKLAPFIEFDKNPYIVLNETDGKLYWIIDGYSITSNYPYSQIYAFNNKRVNYIRNSVKAVVDAYNGDVQLYVYDSEDPILKTYSKIYPEIFTDKDNMDEGLKVHVKYPQDYFNLQGEIYKKYHVDNPMVFYNGEDMWDISNEKFMEDVQRIESNYVMFKLPNEDKAEFSLILPYTPREKPNMTSLFVGRSDGEHYGKLLLYRLPKDKTIDGPMMIESRIDQDSTISPQFTLWGQEGSSILRGNVIVVPINNSILYVEPIYIQADNKNAIPEMKRVIIVYKNKIVMEENLKDALLELFSDEIGYVPSEDIGNTLVDELQNRYYKLLEDIKGLEEIINQLIDQQN